MSRDHLIGFAFLLVGVLLLIFSVLNIINGNEDASIFRIHINVEFE